MKKRTPATLTEYLESTEMTQTALAEKLGIAPSFISQIISGHKQPSLDVAARIEDMTGVPMRALLRKSA